MSEVRLLPRADPGNPLSGSNRLKLGVFGGNLGGGCVATQAPRGLPATWPAVSEVARLAIDNLARAIRMEDPHVAPDVMRARKARLLAGYGSYPLVGTPDQILSELEQLSDDGVDGLGLSWVDYAPELRQFVAEIMPRLEQTGLRQPLGKELPS